MKELVLNIVGGIYVFMIVCAFIMFICYVYLSIKDKL